MADGLHIAPWFAASETILPALVAYERSAHLLGAGWPRPGAAEPANFFSTQFRPAPPVEALLTGYYEPELAGSETPDATFTHPLYSPPANLGELLPWRSRSEIESGNLLAGHEIVWLDSAVEAFLAQVQGSARVRLPDGRVLRLGHAGRNGHPYRSIGAELVRRGEVAGDAISADAIRAWCARNPDRVCALLWHNPSFAFFRVLDLPAADGPIGTAGVPLTPLASLAVDPSVIALGTPVWVEAEGEFSLLMIAQDTGSAIVGPRRADMFLGTGQAAGVRAGSLRARGRIRVLHPVGPQ